MESKQKETKKQYNVKFSQTEIKRCELEYTVNCACWWRDWNITETLSKQVRLAFVFYTNYSLIKNRLLQSI